MTPTLELEGETILESDLRVPLENRLNEEEDLIERQRRLAAANKELSLHLAKQRAEYKRDIGALVGAEKMTAARPKYQKLLREFAAVPNQFPHTPEGNEQAKAAIKALAKKKHELYHNLGFDTHAAIAMRKQIIAKARAPIGKLIGLDMEVPQKPGLKPPKPDTRALPFVWRAAPYESQWYATQAYNGSAGARSKTLSASAATGEVNVGDAMWLFGADDSDFSIADLMAEVGVWYQMPAAGLVEAWILLQDISTNYSGTLWDESGCSDCDIEQLSRAYIWTSGSVERYATLLDYRRGESEGSWNNPATNPGNLIWRQLFSKKSYASGEWVYVSAGIRDLNYFWLDDMSCRSDMTSRYFIKNLVLRSTGG